MSAELSSGPEPIWATGQRPVLADDWRRDGNAFALLGAAKRAQKRAGWNQEEMDAWYREATAGDYDHLLRAILAWHDQPGEGDPDD